MIFPFRRKRGHPSEITLGDHARELGDWRSAAKHYRSALERNPERPAIWVQYGHALKESGKRDHAEAAYRRASSCDPSLVDPHLQLGHLLKLEHRADEAKRAYLRAIALDPGLSAALHELQELGWSGSDSDELGGVPTASNGAGVPREIRKASLLSRADAARDSTLWGLAAGLYREALDRNPRQPAIWVQYGHALKEAGGLNEATQAYRTAVTYDPANADAWLQLGHALKLARKHGEAEAAYLRAFALEPAVSFPLHELSELGWSRTELSELRGLFDAPNSGSDNRGEACVSAKGSPTPGANVSSLQIATDHGEQTVTDHGEQTVTDHGEQTANPELNVQAEAITLAIDAEPQQPDPEVDEEYWLERFDAAWYLKRNPDVARAGADPFRHFIKHGLKEGRAPNPAEVRYTGVEGQAVRLSRADVGRWTPVCDADIHCLKSPVLRGEVALCAAHSPDGGVKPHLRHFLASLRRQGIAVVLILNADQPFADDQQLINELDGLFVRQNQGYDFAAWAHVLFLHPELYGVDILYLVNDSIIGPTNDLAFGDLLSVLRHHPADMVGLTENLERGWHIQSYFLAFKQRTLSCAALHKFFLEIVSFENHFDVVTQYELRLAPTLKAAGINCEALFRDFRTPTIWHWNYLLESGFPFIKVKTLTNEYRDCDITGWREALASRGYDVSLADPALTSTQAPINPAEPRAAAEVPLASPVPVVGVALKVAFLGPWNYDNGLGVASRGYISALRHTNLSLNLLPIRKALDLHQRIAPAVDICDFSGSADVAIVHYNPDGWSGLLTEGQEAIIERARVRVGPWVWEMAELPEAWYPGFDDVDQIWAPSRYCAENFAARAKVPVEVIPYVISIPVPVLNPAHDAAAVRHKLGLAQDERIILYAFDGSSYLIRKNPFALVNSFARTDLAERGWRLVLKVKNLLASPDQARRLQEQIEGTYGVVLVDRSLDTAAMSALMRAADIYASPHCSEGFGLTIAEAMALGKIVVATDYAGSHDFLDDECGFPVRYQLAALDHDHGHYKRAGGAWAQIDEAHLAESLMAAAELVERGDRRLGEAARHRIAERLSPAAIGARMQESMFQLLGIG